MSRTSRVPYHQNVYDLLQAEIRPLTPAAELIREWEQRTARRFPAAMTEFYSSEGELRYGAELEQRWVLPLVDLWSEFSNDEQASTISELFGDGNRPENEWRIPTGYLRDQYPQPMFRMIVENQGNWVLFAYADGVDDPPVFTSDGEYGPWLDYGTGIDQGPGWRKIGTFSENLYLWFASYYVNAAFVPLSFNTNVVEPRYSDPAPPKPYRNGLWLRTPAEPFEPSVIDYLTEQIDEPERTPRPGNVTTYTFRPPGGIIRVTADEPYLVGALSAWWIHADTSERLAELARLILPFGTLRETLRADTDPARDVLRAITGERPA